MLFNLAVRGTLLIVLYAYSWQAFVGYLAAYCLFEIVLRIMDMHQHTFEIIINLDQPRDSARFESGCFDRNYERHNTYSNPLGSGVVTNLLVLNFGFHSAHHEKPTLPWYRLPALDRELGSISAPQKLRFRDVLRSYRKYHGARMLNNEHANTHHSAGDGIEFIGVLGVSFLTAL